MVVGVGMVGIVVVVVFVVWVISCGVRLGYIGVIVLGVVYEF